LPIKKIYLVSLIILISLSFVFSPLMEAKTCSLSNQTTVVPIGEEDGALEAMLNSFKLYFSYFNDTEIKQGYYLPIHGRTRVEAINYLKKGFDVHLATAIVDEYTWFIPELSCLAIRPGDGLPILNGDDIPCISYYKISNEHVIFSREFTGCYSPTDRYRYQVEMQLYQDDWKISALSLEEL
jgi:hypothetical protein